MPWREPAETIDVVHDVDRDGLGSAAMICAELGPEHGRLHPTKLKDIRPLLLDLDGPVIVLDIPAPRLGTASTPGSTSPGSTITSPHGTPVPRATFGRSSPPPQSPRQR